MRLQVRVLLGAPSDENFFMEDSEAGETILQPAAFVIAQKPLT
ncbi:MAG: hypothetical protein ACE5DX_01860 [Candidatus Dojkabacteria bacterium]